MIFFVFFILTTNSFMLSVAMCCRMYRFGRLRVFLMPTSFETLPLRDPTETFAYCGTHFFPTFEYFVDSFHCYLLLEVAMF